MGIIWTESAGRDLDAILDYLEAQDLARASRVDDAIERAVNGLEQFPKRGRPGRVVDTRELIIPKLPYIVVYLVETDAVILRVLHVAQEYP